MAVTTAPPGLGVARGAALYVGALMGPGVLLIPALAAEAAGPASVLVWLALLVLSAPLAATFAALGVRHPEPGGVATYVRQGLGPEAAAVAGGLFLLAAVIGCPGVALVSGFYVADLTGGGHATAIAAGVGVFALAVAANAGGVRVASGVQLALAAVLVIVLAVAVGVALPAQDAGAWRPFAPHGAAGMATAASLLVWCFIGWEAMAQLAGDFRDPVRELPRAVLLAFAVVSVLYLGLAVAAVGVADGPPSAVPLADLLAVGFGEAGRRATAGLAVVLTLGTMNVYVGAGARLAAALAGEGTLPGWLAGGGGTVPRRPLVPLAAVGVVAFTGLAAGTVDAEGLVRATSACFVGVYLLALAAATRLLTGRARAAAVVALGLMAVVAACAAAYLLVPALAAAAVLGLRRSRPRGRPGARPRRPPRRAWRRTRPGRPGCGS